MPNDYLHYNLLEGNSEKSSKLAQEISNFVNKKRFEYAIIRHSKKSKAARASLMGISTTAFSPGQINTAHTMLKHTNISPESSKVIGVIGAGSTALFSAKNSHMLLQDLCYHGETIKQLYQLNNQYPQRRLRNCCRIPSLVPDKGLVHDTEYLPQTEKTLLYHRRQQLKYYGIFFALSAAVSGLSVTASVDMQRENDAKFWQLAAAFLSSLMNNFFNMSQLGPKLNNLYNSYCHRVTNKYRQFYEYIQQAQQLPETDRHELVAYLEHESLSIDDKTYYQTPLDALANLITQTQILRYYVDNRDDDQAKLISQCCATQQCNTAKKAINFMLGLILIGSAVGGALPFYYVQDDLKKHFNQTQTKIFSYASLFNNSVINGLSALYMLTFLITAMDSLAYANQGPNQNRGCCEPTQTSLAFFGAGLATFIPMAFSGLFYAFNIIQNHGKEAVALFSGIASMVNIFSASYSIGSNYIYKPSQNRIDNKSTYLLEKDKQLNKQLKLMAGQVEHMKTQQPCLFSMFMNKTASDNIPTPDRPISSTSPTEDAGSCESTPNPQDEPTTPTERPRSDKSSQINPDTIKREHFKFLFSTISRYDETREHARSPTTTPSQFMSEV